MPRAAPSSARPSVASCACACRGWCVWCVCVCVLRRKRAQKDAHTHGRRATKNTVLGIDANCVPDTELDLRRDANTPYENSGRDELEEMV